MVKNLTNEFNVFSRQCVFLLSMSLCKINTEGVKTPYHIKVQLYDRGKEVLSISLENSR